jgi:PST family polysaccharide transporter
MVETSRAAKSLFWSGLENGGLAVISLGGLVLYSRLLSPADFGLFSVTLSIFELCSLLATMVFHDALIQYRSVKDIHFDSAFTVSMAISFLLVGISWLCAPLFESVAKVNGAGAIFFAMSLSYPALAASSTIVARQRRELDFRALAIRSLGGRIAGAVAGLVAAAYGLGVWSLVIQQICTSFVGSIVLWLAADYKPRFRFNAGAVSEIAHFGLMSTSNLVLSFSAKRLFVFIAGLRIGFVEAGYLNIAFRIVDMLWSILATAVTQVSLPMLSDLRVDEGRLSRAYYKSVSFACLFLFPCFTGIALVAPELVSLVFGSRWQPAALGVALLALLAVVQTPRLFVNPLLTAMGRPRDVLFAVGFELAVLLTLMSALPIEHYELALAVWIFSECVQIPVSTVMLRRATGYGLAKQFSGAVKPLLAVGAMACAVEICRILMPGSLDDLRKLAIMAPVGVITYTGMVFLIDGEAAFSLLAFVASAVGMPNRARN